MDIFEMDLIDWFGEVLPSAPESPVSPLVPSSPESPASPLVPPSSSPPVFPPSLPLPPPLEPVSSLHLVTPSLRLCQAPPSLRLHLHPQSHRLRHGLPDPCLRLSRLSLQLRLGPPDPRRHPGSPSARFHLGLHLQQLSLRQSAPWCCRSLPHHGSSRRQLHRGPPSWLASGLPPGSSLDGVFSI